MRYLFAVATFYSGAFRGDSVLTGKCGVSWIFSVFLVFLDFLVNITDSISKKNDCGSMSCGMNEDYGLKQWLPKLNPQILTFWYAYI